MASETSNVLLHIKRIVHSSIRLACQTACDYPIVLGAGILLLFLHRICPSLFSFLLSSSPVFLLTALLLGALLSYGEPCPPLIGDETVENQQTFSPKSNVPITDSSTEKIENVDVKVHAPKRFEAQVIYTEERTYDDILHDTHCDQENATYLSADTVLYAESSKFPKNDVIVEREQHANEISEKVELQEFGSTNSEKGRNEMKTQYQFGELMSSCWQPVIRQDPCSDSESDLTESSSDASMTDIIPMLDELNQPVDLGTGHSSSTHRDNLHSSSDDGEDDSEEDGGLSSNEDGEEEKEDDGNNLVDVNDVTSSDTEKNGHVESLMERRRAKNILKFELDKRLMDMQAADAIQKMEEASRFRVQVPSISTPRVKPFDPAGGSEEIVELPQIPDSAPSVLLPWRKTFDILFDQIVDNNRQLQETWTPRSHFPLTQHRKHGNLYMRQSTNLQCHNGIKAQKPELGVNGACDRNSDSDSEGTENNVKLFGSLEAHIGEEIKILSAATSDGCVLEVNCGVDEDNKNIDSSDDTNSFYFQNSVPSTSEKENLVAAGSEQPVLCSLSQEKNSEQNIIEADSISKVNSLFKCRMEEVLVQSISESAVGQPLTVKLGDETNDTSPADFGMPVIVASSVEELNSQLAQLNEEAFTCAASNPTSGNEWIQDRTIEELPAANGQTHTSELPIIDRSSELLTAENQQARHSSEIQVIEARSTEEINSLMKQHCEEAQNTESYVQAIKEYTTEHLTSTSEQPGYISELHVVEASSISDINAALSKLHDKVEMHSASDPTMKLEDSSCSGLHVVEARSVAEENSLVKEFESKSQMEAISDSCLEEPKDVKVQGRPNELLAEDCGLPVLEACSIEEMNSLFKQIEEGVQTQMPQSSDHEFGQQKGETASGILVPDAKSSEDISSAFRQLSNDHDKINISGDGEVILVSTELNSGLHVMETNTMNGDDTFNTTKAVKN
ncbi:hypothetical protein ACP70R_046868 [Stipagrostis hirtigluma subsp. patula]